MPSSTKPARRRFPLALDHVRGGDPAPAARTSVQRPQRMAQQAAAGNLVLGVPVGLGLDSSAVRTRMVQRLRACGVRDERVLDAFARVERHRFVDSALANQAYEDTSLPIGLGQTISKPSVVAQMLELLIEGRDRGHRAPLCRVLEVGTGCGYQAALLACLAESVVSIERLGPLAEKALANLQAADVKRVELIHGDGRGGAVGRGPFDAIISAAGGDDVPAAWLEQLAAGGRLVSPTACARLGVQELVVIDRGPHGYSRRVAAEVYFVPLKSGTE